jgi:hypothetical protein
MTDYKPLHTSFHASLESRSSVVFDHLCNDRNTQNNVPQGQGLNQTRGKTLNQWERLMISYQCIVT